MTAASQDLASATVSQAYSRWARVYDGLCGPLFAPAHLAAAAAANRIGGRILEVGVGTGLILSRYSREARVTGIDLSGEMLAKARERCNQERLGHVERLERMDVHALEFEPASFDVVVMPFVLTLVENPERALGQCLRVLRSGGEIIVVSHFQSATPWIAALERRIAPLVADYGLRPDFPLDRLRLFAMANVDVAEVLASPVGRLGMYRLVRIVRA